MPATSSTCAARGCGRRLRRDFYFMCVDHWGRLPKLLQDNVWREYKSEPGTSAHYRAMHRCVMYLAWQEKQNVLHGALHQIAVCDPQVPHATREVFDQLISRFEGPVPLLWDREEVGEVVKIERDGDMLLGNVSTVMFLGSRFELRAAAYESGGTWKLVDVTIIEKLRLKADVAGSEP